MPIPKPKVPLKDHCSVIYNDKLYTYQPGAFQSLDLKEGGEWTQLPMGVSTKGAACVLGSFDDQAAFLVVGGSTDKDDYNGLQHYSFQRNKWTSDKPTDTVTTNRRRHGAVFLQKSSEILTYGGSQDDDRTATSQTFLISTKQPYGTRAFNSQAPPVSDPLLLEFNTTHALMLGGDITNTKLFTFSPDAQWNELPTRLNGGLKDSSKVQATITTASDGSKVLEIFDFSSSPNKISPILLQNTTSPSSKHRRTDSHHPSKRRKREIPLSDRPAYNSTLAPQDARPGFSIASDDKSGLVIASGGNDQVPLAMFNDTGNQWLDPNQFFGGEQEPAPIPSATSTTLPSSTSSSTTAPAAATSVAAQGGNDSRNRSLTILGGVLGGVLGAAILLILLLLLLRYLKKRRERKQAQRQSEYKLDEKGEMDFMDMGADFMREAGGSAAHSPQHGRSKSESSAKQKDRSGAASSLSKRALLHAKGDSTGSNKSFWSKGSRSPDPPPQISAPIISGPSLSRSIASPEVRNDTGWSRYFTENPAPEGFARSAPRVEEPRQGSLASNAQTQSTYTSSALHSSAEVEPLSLRSSQHFPPPGLGVALSHGVSRDTPSNKSPIPSIVSDIEEESEYHHSNGQDSWSPVESGSGPERNSGWTDERPISSTHNSAPYPHPGERVRIPNFPMPTSGRSSAVASIASPVSPQGAQPPQLPTTNPGLRNVVSRDLLRSHSQRQRAEGPVRTGTQRVTPTNAATVHPFQRPQDQHWGRTRESDGSQDEDMSWLNLGNSADHHGAYYSTSMR